MNVQEFLGTNGIKRVSWGYQMIYIYNDWLMGTHEDVMGIDGFLNLFISFHLVLCINQTVMRILPRMLRKLFHTKSLRLHRKCRIHPKTPHFESIFHVPVFFIDFLYWPNQNLQKSPWKSPQVQPTSASCPFPCCIPVSAISGVVIWAKAAWFLLRWNRTPEVFRCV